MDRYINAIDPYDVIMISMGYGTDNRGFTSETHRLFKLLGFEGQDDNVRGCYYNDCKFCKVLWLRRF